MIGTKKIVFGVSTCFVILASGSARALSLNSFDTGWYDNSGFHRPGNSNYISGNVGLAYRSFFAFDLSSVIVPPGQKIVSATLTAQAFTVSADSQILSLYDYTGSISNLLDGTGGVAAFNDLGEGTSFGSRTFNFSDSNTLTSYVLNQNFINSFNSSLPGNFVIGARNGNEGISSNYVYGFSGGGAPATLDLQFGPDIPAVPGPLPILGVAAAFGYSRKLRKRIKSSRPEVISTTAV